MTDEEKPHVSHSALKDWLDCGKRYQLRRLLKLPEKPAMWNSGGRSVHAATEAYDLQLHAALGV